MIQDDIETKVIVSGRSNSFVDLFFIVRNRYETIINNRTLLPRYFKRNNNEGGYLINQEYFFNQDLNIVNTQNGKFKTNINTFDMLSSFLYGRSLKTTDLKKKESYIICSWMKKFIIWSNILEKKHKYRNCKIKCLKFSPKVQIGRVFKNEDDLTIWVSDDKNHLLIKLN